MTVLQYYGHNTSDCNSTDVRSDIPDFSADTTSHYCLFAFLAGAFIGALLSHVPADMYGRRATVLLNNFTHMAAAVICIESTMSR